MKFSTRQIAFLGIMLVFAMMAGYMERLLPPIIPALPGIKLGLSNIIVLTIMYLRSNREALCLNILRVLLNGLLFTGVWGTAYAMSGAILSFVFMALFKKSGYFGIVGVSVIGGVCHNLGQICIAALVIQNTALLYYFPVLILTGTVAGVVIGYTSGIFIKRIKDINIASITK